MKKLWVFGTSHSAGQCKLKNESISRYDKFDGDQFLVNPYPKLIHNETEYSVKNFAIPGINHDMQLFFITSLVNVVEELPDVIIIEHRSFFEKAWTGVFDSIFNTISHRTPDKWSAMENIGTIGNHLHTLCEDVAIRSDVKNDVYLWFRSAYDAKMPELKKLIDLNSSFFLNDYWKDDVNHHTKNTVNYHKGIELLDTLGINYEKEWLTLDQWLEFVRFYSMNMHCTSVDVFKKIMDFIGAITFLKNLGIKVKWLQIDGIHPTRCYLRNLQNKLIEDALFEDCIHPYSRDDGYNEERVMLFRNEDFLCDCGHPNDKAHRIFADIIKNEL
jgi:hypothetical protein|tara:strand:- start:1591 stop:2577 length:987 start_codon:yes stop_codon:yes gene_type:complete